ncbi:MAG: diaminopimelate epimerase [Verrucomicrobiota bacterium]|nr:diaminopimelate epimerase [Verrucomicrobiota bacterium]
MLKFTKMNGAGNDFVLADNRDGALHLDGAQIARICDRHRGVGADGVLLVEPAQNGADFRMRYYNSDGGEAEMCGNGARCFARFAGQLGGQRDEVRFETIAGVITGRCLDGVVELEMSEPRNLRLNESLENFILHSIDTGVPHAVLFVDNIEKVDVAKSGALLRYHERFAPRGTNVNFVQKIDAQTIAIRTYERGVEAETLACGTGVVASALVFHSISGAQSPVQVRVRGGDLLAVGFQKHGDDFFAVTLTGPAEFVFEGEIDLG